MIRKVVTICVLLVFLFSYAGCYTQTHIVGDGAQGTQKVEKRQWFALWGLVPISEVDSKTMAEGAEDYTITTETTFIDGLISVFTGIVTIGPRTVRVVK